MKKSILALLLLSLAMTGCIVEPGGGHGNGDRGGYHSDRGGWGR